VTLVKVASYYGNYWRAFYAQRPWLRRRSYDEQLAELLRDCFSWADFYGGPLQRLGYRTVEIIRDVEPLQQSWAIEHGLPAEWALTRITARQIEEARPDILWFEDSGDDAGLILGELEENGHRPRLVLGWTGSFVAANRTHAALDCTLSCAPEAVEFLRARGAEAEHLDHGFSPLVIDRMHAVRRKNDLAFFGHIFRNEGFHQTRADVLCALADSRKRIRIYTPHFIPGSAGIAQKALHTAAMLALYPAKLAVYGLSRLLLKAGLSARVLSANRYLRRALELTRPPRAVAPPGDLPPQLMRCTTPAVYGLRMYEAIAASRIVLNVHADSSPRFASNMRLFEVTGGGSLLLTDWRENLPQLFEPDAEVVTYRSAEECVEKAEWLLAHDADCARIAAAGHARCLRDHSFDTRAARLHELIRARLR
jgi:spore maturation protein CgeB